MKPRTRKLDVADPASLPRSAVTNKKGYWFWVPMIKFLLELGSKETPLQLTAAATLARFNSETLSQRWS